MLGAPSACSTCDRCHGTPLLPSLPPIILLPHPPPPVSPRTHCSSSRPLLHRLCVHLILLAGLGCSVGACTSVRGLWPSDPAAWHAFTLAQPSWHGHLQPEAYQSRGAHTTQREPEKVQATWQWDTEWWSHPPPPPPLELPTQCHCTGYSTQRLGLSLGLAMGEGEKWLRSDLIEGTVRCHTPYTN